MLKIATILAASTMAMSAAYAKPVSPSPCRGLEYSECGVKEVLPNIKACRWVRGFLRSDGTVRKGSCRGVSSPAPKAAAQAFLSEHPDIAAALGEDGGVSDSKMEAGTAENSAKRADKAGTARPMAYYPSSGDDASDIPLYGDTGLTDPEEPIQAIQI